MLDWGRFDTLTREDEIMGLRTLIRVVATFLFVGITSSLAVAQEPTPQSRVPVTIQELGLESTRYLGETVSVTGTLGLAEGNYFTNPTFVLLDENGSSIQVTPWAPLEVPPPIPGGPSFVPKTMNSFIGQKVTVAGTYQRTVGSRAMIRVDTAASLPPIDSGVIPELPAVAQPTGAPFRENSESKETVPNSRNELAVPTSTLPPRSATPQRPQRVPAGPAEPTGTPTRERKETVPNSRNELAVPTSTLPPRSTTPQRPQRVPAGPAEPTGTPTRER
jgi:hypothetical protein